MTIRKHFDSIEEVTVPEPSSPEPEPEEISLEEWIASTQSCCGIEPEAWRKPKLTPSDPTGDPVQSGHAEPQ